MEKYICLAGVEVSGKWGFIDKTGKMVIAPQFQETDLLSGVVFSEGLAAVRIGNIVTGKCGYIDTTGKFVIEPQFNCAMSFSDGLARVQVNGKWGYINKNGKKLIKLVLDDAMDFSEGFSAVCSEEYDDDCGSFESKWGFISKKKMVVELQFEEVKGFSEGLAAVRNDYYWGYIDENGEMVIDPQFDDVEGFSEGLAAARLEDWDDYGYIDKTGAFVIKPQFNWAASFSEGLAQVRMGYGKSAKDGYIDKTGKIIIEPKFDDTMPFAEGLACVRIGDHRNRKYGFIDKTGNYVIYPQYDDAANFSNGLARVEVNGKWGYIDKTGKFAIKPQFKEAGNFVITKKPDDVSKSRIFPYYLFFDTETTGLPIDYSLPSSCTSNWPRLVQLSWIVTDRLCNVIRQEDYIIYPDNFRIPIDAANVHGITTEKARKNGVRIETVINSFLEDFNKCNTIVGHNIDFDKKILGAELVRMGLTDVIESKPIICTMKKSTSFCKIPNSNGLGYKWPKLQELHKKLFGREFNDAHNSMADVQATLDCFKELIIRGLV